MDVKDTKKHYFLMVARKEKKNDKAINVKFY
jgi:hypothetical protein